VPSCQSYNSQMLFILIGGYQKLSSRFQAFARILPTPLLFSAHPRYDLPTAAR
jgi:hypothetical protein